MKIIDNIIKRLKEIKIERESYQLKEKENIINTQNDTILSLKNRINDEINEMEKTLVNINKAIAVLELDVNDKKPVTVYRSLQDSKFKIKSSIATSKQLLNQLGLKYLPETNFTIINLKNQEEVYKNG